jgi:hypothetical protein
MEKLFYISEAQRNAVLNYLKSRPYSEVAEGVAMLQNLAEHDYLPKTFEADTL